MASVISEPKRIPHLTLRQEMPSLVVSLVLHVLILGVMAAISIAVGPADNALSIETVLADDTRVHEEYVQQLDEQQEIAETLNFLAGSVSTEIGGSNAPLSKQTKLDFDEVVKDPDLTVDVSPENIPATNLLGEDLGQAEVTGEVGAVVEGYGPALDRLTQELIRLLRQHELLVVWLFDESNSMKDDQQEIKQRIHRVYEELKLIEKQPTVVGGSTRKEMKLQDVLLSAITSFGEAVHVHTPKPTGDVRDILPAIDRVPIDTSGTENMCQALAFAIEKYRAMARARKLVLIVVSDESGDDGEHVEEVLHQAKALKAPIYILGREAVFGSLYAHVRWIQPYTGHLHYLPIRRGPETPFAEQLQYDGFRRRRDSHMSGFGPYEQVRLAKETGGIFFQLPYEEEDLNDFEDQQFEMLALREYLPDLGSRRDYVHERDSSDFRRAVWDVIVLLNPYNPKNDGLELPDPEVTREWFSTNLADYGPKVRDRLQQIVKILSAMASAQKHLEKVRPLREKEASVRWRANYDLIVAQLFWYRVRLFEYAIGLDQFAKRGLPQALKEHPMHNRWSIVEDPSDFVVPDEGQQKLLGVTPDELIAAREEGMQRLKKVRELHPGTPWARRAEWELNRKFGVRFKTYYQPPPQPHPPRKQPTPPPPPKL